MVSCAAQHTVRWRMRPTLLLFCAQGTVPALQLLQLFVELLRPSGNIHNTPQQVLTCPACCCMLCCTLEVQISTVDAASELADPCKSQMQEPDVNVLLW